MEGNSAQMFVSSNEVAVHTSKTNACEERGSVGIWNSGLMDKPLADTYHTFWSNNGVIAPARITAVGIVNGGVQVPIFSGAAKKVPAYYTPPPTSYLAFPSNALRGGPFPKEGNQLTFSPPLNGIGEIGAHRSLGQSSQAKFDVQLSEVCQRRFVMFDRSGSKRRMIFHPAMMNEFSDLLPSSLPKTGAYNFDPLPGKTLSRRDTAMVASPLLSSLPKTGAYNFDPLPGKTLSRRDMAMVASPLLGSTTPLGSSFPYHNSHLLLRNTFVDSHSSASDNWDTPLLSTRENAEAKREQNGDGASALSCYSHENTEDLEALLSSDEDEVSSTGHSPSDLTRNNSPSNSYGNNEGHSICASKKRKEKTENHIDDEDTSSTATSGTKLCKEAPPCQDVDGADINSSYGKEGFAASCKATHVKDLGFGNEDLTAFDMFFSDEVSSSCSANNQKWDNKVLSTQPQQPDVQSRKEKIKSVLRLLRGIIPGGESMDTAFVLDEAIQYVKTLQFEVQKLQGRKLT